MIDNPRVVAIIPARGGSRRIPGKNIRMFHGKPILAYSIKTAVDTELFQQIIVSTDSPGISDIAIACGAEVHYREALLCLDNVGTQEVARAVALQLRPIPDYVCCIYATAPLMSAEDISEGLGTIGHRTMHYALSVGTDPLRDAAQFYWSDVAALSMRLPLIGKHTAMIPVPEERVCDINDESDWILAEAMYANLHGLG